jgi:hypothetical protein
MPKFLSSTSRIAATAAVLLATVVPAAAAWYIKFDGVDGEAAGSEHKEWIEIASVRLASARSGRGVISSGSDPVPAGLLLPAVQKARVATAAAPAWRGCTVGQRLPRLPIRNDKTGRSGAILDAVVTDCGAEQVSFNFTKIEMR